MTVNKGQTFLCLSLVVLLSELIPLLSSRGELVNEKREREHIDILLDASSKSHRTSLEEAIEELDHHISGLECPPKGEFLSSHLEECNMKLRAYLMRGRIGIRFASRGVSSGSDVTIDTRSRVKELAVEGRTLGANFVDTCGVVLDELDRHLVRLGRIPDSKPQLKR